MKSKAENFKDMEQGAGCMLQDEGLRSQDLPCNPRPATCTVTFLIIILSAAALYYLSASLIGQIHFHKAKNLFQEKNYNTAVEHLKKAEKYQPNNYQIKKYLGDAYFNMGGLSSGIKNAMILMKQSKDYYLKAVQLNPLDAENFYGLARGEERLESLYKQMYPDKKEIPYNPLPYFKEAVRLRPNGISYNYSLISYLYKQGDEKGFFESVQRLVRIYPNTYYYLKREKFWSQGIRDVCKKGLEDAVNEGISVREAYVILSSITAEDKDWRTAISYYQKAIREKTFENSTANYIYFGSLYLKDAQFENAEICFFHGLKISKSREKDLARIYPIYKNENQSEKFCQFYQEITRNFTLSYQSDILFARALTDLKKYQDAKEILNQVNKKEHDAEAYYWLARIAELEQDWDSMELAIHKATVLDPKNRTYHQVFSNVLRRLKKYDRANEEARLAAQKP